MHHRRTLTCATAAKILRERAEASTRGGAYITGCAQAEILREFGDTPLPRNLLFRLSLACELETHESVPEKSSDSGMETQL